jgi:hypothetical protein
MTEGDSTSELVLQISTKWKVAGTSADEVTGFFG